jgi:intracellular sulfur oxidation DsrE/DsrF family protein
MSEIRSSSPQALRTVTTITSSGEALAYHVVTFNFIVKLLKTSRGNDSICVFVDKLTKMVHFVACKEALSAKDFAELYVDHVLRFHGRRLRS